MTGARELLVVAAALVAGAAAAAAPAQVYAERCATSHAAGTGGAPRVGDEAEWRRRIRPGLSLVYRSALEGMPNTLMMAKAATTTCPTATSRRSST